MRGGGAGAVATANREIGVPGAKVEVGAFIGGTPMPRAGSTFGAPAFWLATRAGCV